MSVDTRVARPAVPVHRALPARRDPWGVRIGGPLQAALVALNEADQLTPCAWLAPTTDLWCSDSRAERLIGAQMCHGCPVVDACDADATQRGEQFGVWGGNDRTPR